MITHSSLYVNHSPLLTCSQCSWCSFSTLTPSMMFLLPVFNPNFLLLAHPLYNQCLFYHISTLFLNSNPLWWWCLFSVLAPSSLFLLPIFNPDIQVWCLACNALQVSENLLSCRQLTTVSSGIEISWSYCIQLTDHGLVCNPLRDYKNLI